jgi:serine/threonine-protein kinase
MAMSKKEGRLLIVLTVAGLLIVYYLANWIIAGLIHSRPEVIVPDLRGRSLPEALKVLSVLNLGLRQEATRYDKDLPSGMILSQLPAPGLSVRTGRIINVVVSQGGEKIIVPDLSGMAVRQAEIELRRAGLMLGEVAPVYSVKFSRDKIVRQEPAVGSFADKDSFVNVSVSQGPPPPGIVLMPDFVGQDIASAENWARANGFSVERRDEPNMTLRPGTIISQEPVADTELSRDSRLSFIVVAVPEVGQLNYNFYYEVPQGPGNRQIRLLLMDALGEREVYNQSVAAGSRIELALKWEGPAKVKIFVDGVLVDERQLK